MQPENRRLDALERRVDRLTEPVTSTPSFARYRDDPVAFREEVLGFDSATRRSSGEPYQDTTLRAVAACSRVAILAGHGVGKTRTVAALALWWLVTRPYSRVVIVAPQFERQIRGVIFSEITKLVRRAKVSLPVEVQGGQAFVTGYGHTWAIIGVPATEPDRIEGQHAEGGVLLIMDETKGVGQDVFDAMLGSLTGGDDSRLLVASTPGGASGPFYRACNNQFGLWTVIHVDAEDSSRVSPEWYAPLAKEWGRGSVRYQTRVNGRFADAGDGALFPLSLLEAAAVPRPSNDGPVILGVDVARSVAGDMNCIALIRGGRVERFILWRSPDTMATVNRVLAEAALVCPARIVVDVTGVGAGVVDRLKQLHFPVEPVTFGGGAIDPARFRNRRAELFWDLRAALEQGGLGLPEDDELVNDLTAIHYSFDASGRILLEGKDDIRRRLGRSPDRADALALAISAAFGARRRVRLVGAVAGPWHPFFPT